jgi:hypothetical protein
MSPLLKIWSAWALTGSVALRAGRREPFEMFVTATLLSAVSEMLESGMRPASHPTSATKE